MTVLSTRRKLALIGALVVSMVAATVGYIAAQGANIYEEREGDDRIVAIVDGIEVPNRELRRSPEYWQSVQPELTEDEAFLFTIVGDVDRFILLAEVEERGLMPTVAEGEAHMAPHRESCSQVEECENSIRDMGEDVDEHWVRVAPYFREDLGIARLQKALITEAGFPPGTGVGDERAAALEQAVNGLRADAEIEWRDERLADLYSRAIAARDN